VFSFDLYYDARKHKIKIRHEILASNSTDLFRVLLTLFPSSDVPHHNTGPGTFVYRPVFGPRQCHRSLFIPLRPHSLWGPTQAHIASGAQPRPTSPLGPNPGPHRLWGPTQPSNQLVHAGTAKKLKRPELKADYLPNISTAPARLRFFQAFSSVVRQMPEYNLTFKHLMSTIVDVPHR
jgi:hypothetical protein